MTVTLDDSWEKLRWAKEHFKSLKGEIESFEKAHPHRFSVDVDRDTGEYVFHVGGLGEPKAEWGLLIGDCVHNARTALDYVAVRLLALVSGKEPGDIGRIQFPIISASSDDPVGEFAAFKNRMPNSKRGALSGYIARVEQLQPYNNQDPSIWGGQFSTFTPRVFIPNLAALPIALELLHGLDNVDKHRVIHTVQYGCDWSTARDPELPKGYVIQRGSITGKALGNGTEVGRWHIEPPLPEDWCRPPR